MNTGSTPTQAPETRSNAFFRGYKDFFKGNPKSDHFYAENPYWEGSDDSKEWEAGFNAAYFKNITFLKSNPYIPYYIRKKNVNKKAA